MRQSTTMPALPVPGRTMWQFGQQIDHYTAQQMYAYAAEYDAGRADHIAEAQQTVPLTYSQLLEIMDESGWPPSILAEVVKAKLVDFARAIEAAVTERKKST